MKIINRITLVSAFLFGLLIFVSKCINPAQSKDPRGSLYAGAGSCRQCHQLIYDGYLNTAHFLASSLARQNNTRGNFEIGKNEFRFNDSSIVKMEKRDSAFHQVMYLQGKEKAAYPFEVLFGSRHAQTALYWKNDRLYELPVSHYLDPGVWGTSPGYPADKPHFERLVDADCFDCHSSNISIKSRATDEDPTYEKQSLLPGIDCERCHGPALRHVNYHLENPGARNAAWMVRNKDLNHQQQSDACAVCHSGNDKMKIQSRFEFQMGDTLGYFFMPFGGNQAPADVHGNQFGLMVQSKCFSINRMTCGTCHDPHKDANQGLAVYSKKCMDCHQPGEDDFCPLSKTIGSAIQSNCIDCHMPKQASTAISYQLPGNNTRNAYLLRTHKIAVYADSIKHKLQ